MTAKNGVLPLTTVYFGCGDCQVTWCSSTYGCGTGAGENCWSCGAPGIRVVSPFSVRAYGT